MRSRKNNLISHLLNELDYVLGESTRLFIMQRPNLRNEMEWKEESNIEQKQKDNSVKIKTISEEILNIL